MKLLNLTLDNFKGMPAKGWNGSRSQKTAPDSWK